MKVVSIIFPHQLFEEPLFPAGTRKVYLVEEQLFFRQYAFHKQKIAFQRASMKYYEAYLGNLGMEVEYIASGDARADTRELIPALSKDAVDELHYVDTTDNWLEKRMRAAAEGSGIALTKHPSPLFMNTGKELEPFFTGDKKNYSQTSFYIQQRRKRDILLDENKKPLGGKWSFDAENRKKYPHGKIPPAIQYPAQSPYYQEAVKYTSEHFGGNPGFLGSTPLYPVDHQAAKQWLMAFLETRFKEFGPYEDAIMVNESILHHSVLSPMLNTGLLLPGQVIRSALEHAGKNDVPLNSLEGFIRQILGWREFIRGIYLYRGSEERTRNFWGFSRKIPDTFYTASTGIDPVDDTIKKVLESAYCHHIERLMVLGNFMLLCEFDPDEVYRWFMELFIDAYDWVMVPNVYGMSQFADGGLMASKPYISGSNYLMKMGNYSKGPWQQTWDALFWRFLHQHRGFFTKNPRLGMLVKTFDRMSIEKRNAHLSRAEEYLQKLDRLVG